MTRPELVKFSEVWLLDLVNQSLTNRSLRLETEILNETFIERYKCIQSVGSRFTYTFNNRMKNITSAKLSLKINEIRPDTCVTCLLKMQKIWNWNLRCVITENQRKIFLVSHRRVFLILVLEFNDFVHISRLEWVVIVQLWSSVLSNLISLIISNLFPSSAPLQPLWCPIHPCATCTPLQFAWEFLWLISLVEAPHHSQSVCYDTTASLT